MLKKLLIISILAFAGFGIYVFFEHREAVRAAKLEAEILKGISPEELGILLESQKQSDAAGYEAIAASPDSRRAFLNGLREYLSLAAEARRTGLAEDKNFLINVAYKRNQLIAELYKAKLTADAGKPYVVPAEQLSAVWNDPENERQFSSDMDTLLAIQTEAARKMGSDHTPVKLQGESLARARENWARIKVLSDRARSDTEFMKRPDLELRLKVLEAGILSADLLRRHWPERIKATDNEIDAYLSAHPEYDLSKKIEKANGALARALKGENFAALAAEFSEHRPTKAVGGLMEESAEGQMWPELERAALALDEGRIAERLVETEIGFHIVKLEKKTKVKNGDGTETTRFTIRHILFQNKFEQPGIIDPSIPPPFMTAREIATHEVEKEKRARFVSEVLQRNPIDLPEQF